MKKGDYIYCVERDLLGPGIHIKRAVLLEYNEKTDRYQIGDSKMPNSVTSSGWIKANGGMGLGWAETPVEAVNLYVASQLKARDDRIVQAECEIKLCNADKKALLKLDHSKLKTKFEEDDWEPCSY